MRTQRLYFYTFNTKNCKRHIDLWRFRVLLLQIRKTNQASAQFGVVDVQSALLWGLSNECTLKIRQPPQSHNLFKLALKDFFLQAAN